MNTPKIRFKGFKDDWEQRKLGEVCEIKDSARIPNSEWSESGVPYIRASDVTNENTDGVLFISQERYEFYKNRTGAPTKDDVLFNGGGEIGKSLLITDEKPIYVQGGAVLYAQTSKSRELVGQYLKTYFETTNAKSYIDAASAGGTMRHFTLKPSQIMRILMPSVEEQEKIGEYFANLDQLITLHQRKCDETKQLKKFMLQKMFPKNGEKNPEIRFEGFTDDWEQRKLSELTTMHARIGWQNLRTSEFLDSGDYMLITGTDFQEGVIDYSTCHYVEKERYDQDKNIQIKNGSILITKDGTLGKVAYVQGLMMPATLNAGVFNVTIKNENIMDGKYLFQYLKAPFLMDYVSKKATGGTIKHLNQSILVDFPVAMPKREEQVKISRYFTALDNLITLHQRKCEKLKELKKFMLQNMFV